MEDKATQTPASSGPEQKEVFSMEAALQDADARLEKSVQRGNVIKGSVIFVGQEGVSVDIGARAEGIIPFNQLTDEPLPEEDLRQMLKPGDEVTVYVVRADLENGQIILSKKRAEADNAWGRVQELFDKGEPVTVSVVEKVKGGLVAQVAGIRAFLPASQVDLKRTPNLDEYVGKDIPAKIIELNRKKGRVILSRRVLLEAEQKERRGSVLSTLQPGQEVEGQVVEVTEFGVFVALGGVDGLVHRSEITWGRFAHPREVVQKGQTVRAKVLTVDAERERVNLSIKALVSDPWQMVSEQYPIGSRVKGKVVGLTPFGAFVEVQPGLEGLVHISELSWTKRPRHPSEVLKEGDEVEAVVLRIDPAERRLSLGLRQTQPDPWRALPDRYPPGKPVKGKVTGLTDFGVFVEVEPGIEGLIHVSELDHARVENPSLLFKKGDEVEAVILNIDPVEQRVSLSRKRLLPPPVPAELPVEGEAGERAQRSKLRERPDKSKRSNGSGKKSSARPERSLERRDRDFDQGNHGVAQFDPSSIASNTSVKLGDIYGDLLSQLGLDQAVSAAGEAEKK